MRAHIEGNLYITSDERQFCLSELRTTEKEGQPVEYFNHLAYFSTLQGVINHLVKRKLSESTSTTLQELLHDVKRIEEYIKSTVVV